MLSKNNITEKLRKLEKKQQKFSIRKLSVGAASVLIGLIFMGVSTNNVEAATTQESSTQVQADTATKAQDNSTTDSQDTTKAQITNTTTADATDSTPTKAQAKSPDGQDTTTSVTSNAITDEAKDSSTTTVPDTASNQAVKNAPALSGKSGSTDGEQIDKIHSTISVTATNKYTGQSSSSSDKLVQVNEPVAEDLSMTISLSNNTDQEQKINTTWPNNTYLLPAYSGTSAQIVVDPSRVRVENGEVTFGGNYTNSDVSITSWDVAKTSGSTGFNDSQENKDAIAKNPELIGGFSVGGTLQANETVNIIVPLKVLDTQKTVTGNVQREFGQMVNLQVSPEDFRDASDYTSSKLTVDGLTDDNISNLAENNGELTVSGDITNNGFISHDESLEFNLSNVDSTDTHKVQTVLDYHKALTLDWSSAADNITYYVNGTYKTADQMTDSDWDNVTKVKVSGVLQSGQTGKVTIPVKLKNVDQIETDLQSFIDMGPASNRENRISLTATSDNSNVNVTNGTVDYYSELPAYGVMKAIEDEVSGKTSITPTYLELGENDERTYITMSDVSVPHLDKDDFSYINIGHHDPSDTLFTDGSYTIKLDKIFNTFKDSGLTVNISKNASQEATWPKYYYQGANGNKASQVELYVQLQQIFNTQDLTFDYGTSWNSNDSLVAAEVSFYNLNFNKYYGSVYEGSSDLKTTGDYTYELYNEKGNQIDTDILVGKNVPTLSPGTYKVVYHYTINKDEVVSKMATIVVNGTKKLDPEQKTVTRTINYLDPTDDKTKHYYTQSIVLQRTAIENLVTKEITYGDWDTDGAEFAKATAPTIQGYTVINPDAAPEVAVTGNTEDSTVTFIYEGNSHTQVINYVDPKGNTVKTYDVPGKTGETVDTNIQSNVPEGWVITDKTVPGQITFGTTDPSAITVNIKHGTKDVTDDPDQADKVNKTVTRTINVDVDGKTSTYTTQSVTLHRTATEDLVTKEVTYSAWNTDGAKFDAVTAPAEAGYTVSNPDVAPAMDVTGDTADLTVTFVYGADSHTQVINYVDPEGNTVKTYDVPGKTGETVDTNIQSNVPEGWVITDKTVPSQITFGTNDPSAITVNIKHGTKDVTDDPDQADKVSKTVTRTINVDVDGKTSTYITQSVTLHRTATEDLVTKEVTYSAWNTDGAKFDAVTAPAEAGYTVSNPDAAPAMDVTGDTADSTVTFVYGANSHTQVISYVDPKGNTVKTYDVPGKTGETVDTNIQSNVPEGWVITDKTVPSQITFGTNDPSAITVNIKHGTKDVTDDPDQADKVSKTVTRTINVDVDGKTSTYITQSVTLHRTATEDLVTKQVTYSAWNTDGAKFDAVTAPAEAGYTVSNPDAAPAMDVTGDTADLTVTFVYGADSHTQVINYVDPEGKTVKTYDVPGKTGETVDTNIQSNVPEGWVITDKTVPNQITFGSDDPSAITVNIKHGTKDVTNDPDQADKVNKTVTRTINVDVDGKTSTYTTQSVTLHRTATEDLVTKQVTYSAWNTDGAKFDAITAPAEAGYTVSNPDAAPAIDVTGDTADSTVTFVYGADSHTQVINYVDPEGNTVKTYDVPGKTGETVDTNIQSNVPEGWVITDKTVPSQITFGTNDPSAITVNIKHGTKDVTDDPDQADKVSKTVTRTINVDVDGKTSTYTTQSVTLHRTATENLVTKEVTYSAWNTDGAKFDAVTAPAEAGYTVSNPDVAPAMDVTGDTADSTVVFNYTANEQTRKINFVDPNGKTVSTQTVTGKTGTSVTIGNGNGETPLEVPTGYEIVPNTQVPTSVPFNADSKDNGDITVKVQAKIDTVDGRNDKSNRDVYRQVTRTITVNIKGQKPHIVTQTLEFYRTKSTNEVTKAVTYTDWTSNMTDKSTSFPEVEIPTAGGYTRTITGGTITTKDGKDYVASANGLEDGTPVNNINVTVNYVKADQTATIKFVNNADHNDVVGTQEVPGEIGETVPVTLQVPANWQVIGGQNVPSSFTFGSTPIKDTIVYVEHKTEDVTDDPSQKNNVNKTITRTIETDVAGKTTKVEDQTVTLHRIATKDLVTNEVTYGAWNTAKFDAVSAPEIAGYTVSNPDAAPAMDVTSDTKDSTVTFTYDANSHDQVINYIDPEGNIIKTYNVTGKTGERVNVDIQNNVPEGWIITNQTVPNQITFGVEDPSAININVARPQTPTDGSNTSTQPTDNSEETVAPLPNENPDSNAGESTTPDSSENTTLNNEVQVTPHTTENSNLDSEQVVAPHATNLSENIGSQEETPIHNNQIDNQIDTETTASDVARKNSKTTPAAAKVDVLPKQTTANTLPQTGAKNTMTNVFGLLAIGLSSIFSLAIGKKKHKN